MVPSSKVPKLYILYVEDRISLIRKTHNSPLKSSVSSYTRVLLNVDVFYGSV